jgi:hypothetical protein
MEYVVLQMRVETKTSGETSKNLPELQKMINDQASKGYRLHTFETWSMMGYGGGNEVMATAVFERK